MSLTKRTWTTPIVKSHTLTFTGSVSGATTKLTMVFQAASAIYGIRGTINVYVNGTKQSCTWTTNKTETLVGTTYKTKMTSAQITISKPFFTLKLTDSNDGSAFYEETFSFYEIEKTPTAATCSGGVMDGTTKSKVTFTTSGTDATYKATFTLGTYSGSATSTTKELTYAMSNFAAYQLEQQAAVGIAGAEALGQMGANGATEMSGGGGMNPAAMMTGMAMGGAIGQNMAGMMNGMMQGMNGQQQPGTQQPPQGMTPPPVPNIAYHVVQNGQATGPFDMGALSQMVNAGTLTKESLVWKQGMEGWVKAETVQELQSLFGSAVPPVPPVPPQV